MLKSKFEESESAFQYCKDMLAKCDDNTTLDEIISLSQKFIGIEFKFEGMEDISKEICLLKLKYFADEFNSTASSNKFDFSAVQSVSLDGIAYADDPVAKKHLSIIDKSLAEAKEDIRRINQAMILASIEELEAELAKKKIDLTSEIEERKIKIKADVEIRKRKNPDPMPEWLFKNREKRSIKTTEHSDFIYDDVIISPKKKKEEVKKQTQHQPQKKQPQQSKGINPNIRKKNSATLEEILSKSDLMKSSNRVNQFANEAENYAFGKHQNDEKEYNALMDKIIENMEIIAKSSNLSNKVVSGKHSIAKLCSLNKEKLIKAKDVVKKPQEGLSITKVIEGLQQLEQITKKKEKETEAAKEGVEKPFIASKMEVVTNILNPNKNDDESLESLSPANAKFSDDEKKSNIKEARDVLIKSGKKLYDLNSAIEPEEKYDPSMCYKIEKGKKKKNVAPENKIYLQYEPGYKLEPLNVAEPETILKIWNGIITFTKECRAECSILSIDSILKFNRFPKLYDRLISSGNIKWESCIDFLKKNTTHSLVVGGWIEHKKGKDIAKAINDSIVLEKGFIFAFPQFDGYLFVFPWKEKFINGFSELLKESYNVDLIEKIDSTSERLIWIMNAKVTIEEPESYPVINPIPLHKVTREPTPPLSPMSSEGEPKEPVKKQEPTEREAMIQFVKEQMSTMSPEEINDLLATLSEEDRSQITSLINELLHEPAKSKLVEIKVEDAEYQKQIQNIENFLFNHWMYFMEQFKLYQPINLKVKSQASNAPPAQPFNFPQHQQ